MLGCIYAIGQWLSPIVTGDRLPPISNFTLTPVTTDSAILFGGNTPNGPSNRLYTLKFKESEVVSSVKIFTYYKSATKETNLVLCPNHHPHKHEVYLQLYYLIKINQLV